MRIERIVVNASPLITLFRSDQAGLLSQLFSEVLVPEAVWREVVEGDHEDLATAGLRATNWAKRIVVQISPRIAVWNLGAGESEVLTVALDRPDYRAMRPSSTALRKDLRHPCTWHGWDAHPGQTSRIDHFSGRWP